MQQLGDVANTQAKIGDLVPVHADFLLGYAGFKTGLNVGDARYIHNQLRGGCGQRVKCRKLVAADLDRQPLITPQESFQQELPLRCPDTGFHTGNAAVQTTA